MDSRGLEQLADMANLQRAWRWIRSNPDPQYKSYFRGLYSAWATADDHLLQRLKDQLDRDIYEPVGACKLYLPKPSGILRPYTLLGVSDQVVYQAAVNVVAERLFPRVRHRYNKEVFGHLYAGRQSVWFYRKWSDGYSRFNAAVRTAFEEGYRVAATFDITACFDSIDHGVLDLFLSKLGLDSAFREHLVRWLEAWTATDSNIRHHHGIPQGPLGSGLLAEVVLQYFDANRGGEKRVRYLRYVDDIRLFAESETAVRSLLVRLDRLSKDIGLFPQSSKIGIRQIVSPEDEIKSVSRPPESSLSGTRVDQSSLHKRIVWITPRFVPASPTRFKYLLARALPKAPLTRRLWRIYSKQPAYYVNIASYYSRYTRIPGEAADAILAAISAQQLYPAIKASFLRAIVGKLRPPHQSQAETIALRLWRPSTQEPELLAAASQVLVPTGALNYGQLQYACAKTRPWWARAQLALTLTDQLIGRPSLGALLSDLMRDSSEDVAIAAASRFCELGLGPRDMAGTGTRHAAAESVLASFGLGANAGRTECGVHLTLTRIVGGLAQADWRCFFGTRYDQAERQVVICYAYSRTNPTAFAQAMDVWDDLLLEGLYAHCPALGKYEVGHVGSVVASPRLRARYPAIQALVEAVHSKRWESCLSHAQERRTGRPTRPIRHTFVNATKKLLRSAVDEIARELPARGLP